MKHRSILALSCTLLMVLVGCERKAASLSAGPFKVDGTTGIATGQALGIDFEVAGATGVQSEADLKPGQSYGRVEFVLADDVKIQLEMPSGGRPITFQLNGTDYGKLEVGDKVVIDEDRNVTVNDTKRAPQSSSS